MEGAVLRALSMTGTLRSKQVAGLAKSATSARKAETGKMAQADRAALAKRRREAVTEQGDAVTDIVRFRPKGAADRRIKVEYFADPESRGSVLMRLTPATTAELPTAEADEDLLGTQEAADLLNVSRPYLTKLIDAGTFTGVVRTAAGHRRTPRVEVERVRVEMRATRRAALDDMEKATVDLRAKELEVARAKSKRRWVSKSA